MGIFSQAKACRQMPRLAVTAIGMALMIPAAVGFAVWITSR